MRNRLLLALRARRLRRQKGFTLLELLVVVAILAAIAGTATIALQDTDARAAAAAHVAMMDELNKGIRTFRVLRGNSYPDTWDSLLYSTDTQAGDADFTGAGALAPMITNEILGFEDLGLFTLTVDMVNRLNDIGITNLRIIAGGATPPDSVAGTEDCTAANIRALINSRSNAVVGGNMFLSEDANGCGTNYPLSVDDQGDTDPTNDVLDGATAVAVWTGGQERVLGTNAPEIIDGTAVNTAASWTSGAKILMAVGAGPSSNLFDASELAGLTSVPVYRHVAQDQYSRFIILFHIATATGTAGAAATAIVAVDQVSLAAIVDGAGDTKEEELGEWDGTRNTI